MDTESNVNILPRVVLTKLVTSLMAFHSSRCTAPRTIAARLPQSTGTAEWLNTAEIAVLDIWGVETDRRMITLVAGVVCDKNHPLHHTFLAAGDSIMGIIAARVKQQRVEITRRCFQAVEQELAVTSWTDTISQCTSPEEWPWRSPVAITVDCECDPDPEVYYHHPSPFNYDLYKVKGHDRWLYYYDDDTFPGWRTCSGHDLSAPGSCADPASSSLGVGNHYPCGCGMHLKWKGDGSHYRATADAGWKVTFHWTAATAAAVAATTDEATTEDVTLLNRAL